MQARLQTLEQDKLAAEEQGYELAGRLTTAQIGRLQAELRQLRGEALGGGVEYPLRDETTGAQGGEGALGVPPTDTRGAHGETTDTIGNPVHTQGSPATPADRTGAPQGTSGASDTSGEEGSD